MQSQQMLESSNVRICHSLIMHVMISNPEYLTWFVITKQPLTPFKRKAHFWLSRDVKVTLYWSLVLYTPNYYSTYYHYLNLKKKLIFTTKYRRRYVSNISYINWFEYNWYCITWKYENIYFIRSLNIDCLIHWSFKINCIDLR